MKFNSSLNFKPAIFLIFIIIVSQRVVLNAQQSIGFGIHADPLAGWFSSNDSEVTGKEANAGFNFGLTFNKYFYENYAFSTGISLVTAGGSFSSSDTIMLELKKPTEVLPGSKLVYNIKYLTVPIGLKLISNQIGYISLFTDIGFNPMFVLGGNVAVPSQNIAKDNADNILNRFSMGYHVIGGIEYSLGGTTAIVIGINFNSNFTNILKEDDNQPSFKIMHKMLGLHLGLNF